LKPHSFTAKNGFQADIASTETIPKSSSIGTQIQAIEFHIASLNQIFPG